MVPTRRRLYLPYAVKDLLPAVLLNSTTPQFTLLSLTYLLKTWKSHVVSKCCLFVPRDALPVSTLHTWIPHVPLVNWVLSGVTSIAHLYSKDNLKPFSDLKTLFHIPNTFPFQYLQIHNTLLTMTHPSRCTNPLY